MLLKPENKLNGLEFVAFYSSRPNEHSDKAELVSL